MTYDLFSYSGEDAMLDLRLRLLEPHVDRFVIAEGNLTFSGRQKGFVLPKAIKHRKDVIYVPVNLSIMVGELAAQMRERDYVTEPHFRRAFYQKESLRLALEGAGLKDDDVIYYGDIDEVWKSKDPGDKVWKLRQLAYSYYVNNRSPEDWRGTVVTKWKNLKGKCLNDMRANPENIMEDGGWHFSNLGGHDAVLHKIRTYDHVEVNIPSVTDGLQERMGNNEDFLGRGWQFWEDASELPVVMIENRKYLIEKGLWKE